MEIGSEGTGTPEAVAVESSRKRNCVKCKQEIS